MKQVRTIASTSYAAFQPEIDRFLSRYRGREVLIIAAVRSAADDLVWNRGSAFIGLHRFTLTQLAALLASTHLAEKKRKLATPFASEALAARVAHELRESESWKYFGEVSGTPGFPKALENTISELRFADVRPSMLTAAGAAGQDLSQALNELERQLSAQGIADLPEVYEASIVAASNDQHRLLNLPTVVLDTPIRNRRSQELMKALLKKSPEALVCILNADTHTGAAVKEITGEPASAVADGNHTTTLARLRTSLFELEASEQHSIDDTLDYFSAPGEAMECVEIARRILKLADNEINFDCIAVLLRAPEQYQPLLEEAFRRANIPAYFSRGVIRPDPAGRAFLALLACALEDCSASRFTEYLSLGQVPTAGAKSIEPAAVDDEIHLALHGSAVDNPKATPDDVNDTANATDVSAVIIGTLQTPANWEHLLVDAAVIGGAQRWERRLSALDAELRLKMEAAEGNESECSYYDSELTRLQNLREFALTLISALEALPARALWGEWLDALRHLANLSLRGPKGVLAILDELSPIADVGPVTLTEVLSVLQDRLRFLRREPTVRRHGHVFIGGIEEARGRVFDAVFVPGLAEGLFPRKVSEDPLLLDTYRQTGELKHRLARNDHRVERERLLLSIGIAAASKSFTFSFPRIDLAQSRPRVPSLYALELIRGAYGHLPELRGFQDEAADRAPSRLDRPAPREFRDALDDPEYDLVALQRAILPGNLAPASSSMAYLTRVSESLARSLRSRFSQWELRKWTASDGLVLSESDAKDVLNAYRLSARPYSATALQSYAACPYRFALTGMQGLRPRDGIIPLIQMDAMTRGSLFHKVQRQFLTRCRAQELLPLVAENLPLCQELLDSALHDVENEYCERFAPAIERIWLAEIEEIRTDLHGWLRESAKQSDWMPMYFELGFGLPQAYGRDPNSTSVPVTISSQTAVRGAIDLVEQHVTRGTLRVVDHKTGKAPNPQFLVLGGGAVLQPTLYGLVAEQLLSASVESGRLFYCTQRGSYRSLEVPLTSESRLRLTRALQIIDNAIATGKLPAAPSRDACKTCDYRSVCGPYEEFRWKRKPQLDELSELRNMP